MIAPENAMQDSEIFVRLLEAAGKSSSIIPRREKYFAALGREISGYRNIDYDLIGDQGIELGSGGGAAS